MKRIFIDIGHPAHVHYFKNFIKIMESRGNMVFVSARDRYPVKELLEYNQIRFFNRGKGRNSKWGKIFYLIITDLRLLYKAISFKPTILISFNGPYTTHIAKLLNKPSLVIDDTDSATLSRKFYLPFVSHVLNPDVFKPSLGRKQLKFKGYMELSYLHPRYFEPKRTGQEILGIPPNQKYVILRFVNWNAHHDYGHQGISEELKYRAVEEFSKFSKVFITSEKKLPDELEKYRIQINPNDMHEVLNKASLLFGESATMASECAVLGVPSIFIDNDGRSYTDEEQSRYRIVFNFKENDIEIKQAIAKGTEILRNNFNYKTIQDQILTDKISFTDFFVWFVENYPESAKKMQNDKAIQDQFIFKR